MIQILISDQHLPVLTGNVGSGSERELLESYQKALSELERVKAGGYYTANKCFLSEILELNKKVGSILIPLLTNEASDQVKMLKEAFSVVTDELTKAIH